MRESRYLAEVRQLPRPTAEQIDRFVEYVSAAHSWYKHLPLVPPGVPFFFFLDPNAGRDWVLTDTGGAFRDRTSDTPPHERFHYTWQPTAEYRERFGHLQYFTNAGTSFLLPVRDGVLDTSQLACIRTSDGQWLELPESVRDVGAVPLTAVIHPFGLRPTLWLVRTGRQGRSFWPDDAMRAEHVPYDGELLVTILQIVRSLPIDDRAELDASPAAEELRTRWLPAYVLEYKDRMRGAIGRMLDEIDGPA